MSSQLARRVASFKFTYLLISISILFLMAPFFEGMLVMGMSLPQIIFLGVLLLTVWSLNLNARYFRVIAILAIVVCLLHSRLAGVGARAGLHEALILVFYLFFVGGCMIAMIFRIFKEKTVTRDTVQGGVAIYLLMGILWAFFYSLLRIVEPQSFAGDAQGFFEMFYFSFVTLTTLGYGDIIPETKFAQNLAVFQAIVGQVYLTVFVARLLGLHLSLVRQEDDKPASGAKS